MIQLGNHGLEIFDGFIDVAIVMAVILAVLGVLWCVYRLFFPYKDILSQAFAELPIEIQDHVKDNYKQVIAGKKTVDELTDECLELEVDK